MNETIKIIHNHRSIRSYREDMIPNDHIDAIIKAARCAANSVNGQSYTIIEVRDPDKKTKLVDIASKQHWILPASHFFVFCMDFRRAVYAAEKTGKPNLMIGQTEAVMLGATDIGIAIGQATVAAESLGYGVVPIGAIRNNPQAVIDLLDLPAYVFPVVGFVVGVIDDASAIKPRIPNEAVVHLDRYNADYETIIDTYDETMAKYMEERTDGKSRRNWTETTATAFSAVRHPDVTDVLKSQGFGLK